MPIKCSIVGTIASVVILATVFLGGVLVGRLRFRPAGHLHSDVRRQAILSQAQQLDGGEVVIFGDSIVELAFLDRICGHPVLNAGVGGARLEDVISLVQPVLEKARPSAVVISVGVNDAQLSEPRDIDRWLQRYDTLLTTLARYRTFIMAIDPVEVGKPLGRHYFDGSFIHEENAGLMILAEKHGARFIPATPVVTGLTSDGVHPNAQGYHVYKARIDQAFGCQPSL